MPYIDDLIDQACHPRLTEPDLGLNLEVCDLINTKRQSCPHNAAVRIVKHINNRSQHVSLLALELLDFCVKNCGHAFHIQIATKEFLEEFVRKFPGSPPTVPTRTQYRILELIQEWRFTICRHSRYKDDLCNIEKIANALAFRGYMLPEVQAEPSIILGPVDDLKSPEEMEREDRYAMEAKLQELLRTGNAADLKEANRLMKIMSGYDKSKVRDYKNEWKSELINIEETVGTLAYYVLKQPSGEELTGEGQRMFDLCSRHQNRIQQMIQESTEGSDDLGHLLYLNDIITDTLDSSRAVEVGEPPKELPHARIKVKNEARPLSTDERGSAALIDLESILDDRNSSMASIGQETAAGSSSTINTNLSFRPSADTMKRTSVSSNNTTPGSVLVDDLLGLDFDSTSSASQVTRKKSVTPLSPFTGGNRHALGGLHKSLSQSSQNSSTSSKYQYISPGQHVGPSGTSSPLPSLSQNLASLSVSSSSPNAATTSHVTPNSTNADTPEVSNDLIQL
ncbi:ARF-binding protein [Dispira parvispora]|uniref:ARF-binding protein n=1 Tax=Dispira parvispora TaxID=1520584 RepID=A0A9W8E6N9_9FUNG|nr:ARF-binding protein [Dispira parvispora]